MPPCRAVAEGVPAGGTGKRPRDEGGHRGPAGPQPLATRTTTNTGPAIFRGVLDSWRERRAATGAKGLFGWPEAPAGAGWEGNTSNDRRAL